MKRIFQFGSILLAAYLLALPILIGIHAEQHASHDQEVHDQSGSTFQSSDCELCDLYQNQAGVLELPFIPEVFLPSTPIQEFIPHSLALVANTYTSLRGPPII